MLQSRRRVYLVFANSHLVGISPAETSVLLAHVRDIFVSLGDKIGKHPPICDFLLDDTSSVIEAVTVQLAERLLSKKAKLDSGSERWVQLHRKKFEEMGLPWIEPDDVHNYELENRSIFYASLPRRERHLDYYHRILRNP